MPPPVNAKTIFGAHAVPSTGQCPNTGTLQKPPPVYPPLAKRIADDPSLARHVHFCRTAKRSHEQRVQERRDYVYGYTKLVTLSLILAVFGLLHPGPARAQANALSEGGSICFVKPSRG